jgi:PncC family amidohydrolase
MLLDEKLVSLAELIRDKHGKYSIATAESCTGGIISMYLTSIAGSSEYFSSGIVSYSNTAKIELLDVKPCTLNEFGAVSEEVAREMVLGCQKATKSDIAISVTGIAGPGGGSKQKPIGLVCFGLIKHNELSSYSYHFKGSRDIIRKLSCQTALKLILDTLVRSSSK